MTRIVFCVLLFGFFASDGFVQEASAMPTGIVSLTTDENAVVGGIYVDDSFMVYESVWSPTSSGVYTILETEPGVNVVDFIEISHPVFGDPLSLTSPMKGPDDGIYVGATFLNFSFEVDSAVFNLQSPLSPTIEWTDTEVRSLDAQLNGFGTGDGLFAVKGNADGTTTPLAFPTGFLGGGVLDVSSSGVAVGRNARPGTAAAPAVWAEDTLSFLDDTLNGRVYSVRDNIDGGLNFGAVLEGQAYVQFADLDLLALVDENADSLLADEVFVAESNFSVINTSDGPYAYYPGLTDVLGQALPIGQVLDDFAGLELERVGRPFAMGGQLYIPAQGSALLVSTTDVSIVPEPASSTLLTALLLSLAGSSCRRNVSAKAI